MLPYNSRLKEPARILRKNMTDSERLLWHWLRRKRILGVQFYRQKPLGNSIVDFYAPAAHLVIEVDGAQHLEGEARQRDAERTAYLNRQGLRVLRFDNQQVIGALDAVVDVIFSVVRERTNPPCPPLPKGG